GGGARREARSELWKKVMNPPEQPTGPRYYYPGQEYEQQEAPIDWPEFLLARAALADPKLGPVGETVAEPLQMLAQRVRNYGFLMQLRHAEAASKAARAGVPTP